MVREVAGVLVEPAERKPVLGGRLVDADGEPRPDGLRHDEVADLPVEVRAYVGPAAGPPEEVAGRWVGHIEKMSGNRVLDSGPWFEGSAEEVVAWARERTGWVLVVIDPLQWAGTDPKPDDVPLRWPTSW